MVFVLMPILFNYCANITQFLITNHFSRLFLLKIKQQIIKHKKKLEHRPNFSLYVSNI